MDNETRHLNTGDPARAPGAPPPGAPPPAAGLGTPTSYLPPMNGPSDAAPGSGPGYGPPSAGPGYTPPAPQVGTTYAAPNGGPAARPPNAGPTYGTPGGGPGYPGSAPAWASRRGRHGWWPLVLIVVGVLALTGRSAGVFGAAIPLALGLIFLYVATQGPGRYAFRIPGCILTGLGAGIVLETLDLGGGGYSAVGLGLGFLALWAWNRTEWWWLIPGAVVGLGGVAGVLGSSGWHGGFFWPVALLAFGAYLLRGRCWRTRP